MRTKVFVHLINVKLFDRGLQYFNELIKINTFVLIKKHLVFIALYICNVFDFDVLKKKKINYKLNVPACEAVSEM